MRIYVEEHAEVYGLTHKLIRLLEDDGEKVSLMAIPDYADMVIGNPKLMPLIRNWHQELFKETEFVWPVKDQNVGVIIYSDGKFTISGPNPERIRAALKELIENYESIKKYTYETKSFIEIVKEDDSVWTGTMERK